MAITGTTTTQGFTPGAHRLSPPPSGPGGSVLGASAGDPGSLLSTIGLASTVSGVFTSAIGAFFAADAQKYQLASDALTLDHRARLSQINARRAELDVQQIFLAGRQRRALSSLRAGQAKATARARQGSRGIQMGVGSAAEELTSFELAKELDLLTIDANTFREMTAARRGVVDAQAVGILSAASAANVRRSASIISPALASFSSFLSNAGSAVNQFVEAERFETLFASPRGGFAAGGV